MTSKGKTTLGHFKAYESNRQKQQQSALISSRAERRKALRNKTQ